jgi:DNA ligase-1
MLASHEIPLTYQRYFEELTYPKWASPKYDGIRAISKGGILRSRNWKPIRSIHCQEQFWMLDHSDGELLAGDVFAHDVYNKCQSHVMAEDKPCDFSYMVFDYTHPDWLGRPFYERYDELHRVNIWKNIQIVEQWPVENEEELLAVEEKAIALGAEGLILKDPLAPYKNGRSTWRQNWSVKLKREMQSEALIVGLEEAKHNLNEQTRNGLGYAERSHHQENKVGAGMVGTILGLTLDTHEPVRIAPGNLTHAQRKEIWENPEEYVERQVVTFQHFPHGAIDTYRQARCKGLRTAEDM